MLLVGHPTRESSAATIPKSLLLGTGLTWSYLTCGTLKNGTVKPKKSILMLLVGLGYCNWAISLFVSFFVSLSATLWENGWTDFHEIFREGVEWPWDDLIQFWVNLGQRIGGSKVKLFVIWFDCGLLAVLCWHLATENVMKVKLFVITGHSSESVAFARGQGLLCPAPQLVFFCHWAVLTASISQVCQR